MQLVALSAVEQAVAPASVHFAQTPDAMVCVQPGAQAVAAVVEVQAVAPAAHGVHTLVPAKVAGVAAEQSAVQVSEVPA